MKKYFVLLTCILTTALALPAMASGQQHKEKNIVETAVVAGNFNTLAQLLQVAGLVDTLQGPGPFTVFAPTDEAFAKLPAGTLDDLMKPENRDKLVQILTYHVVPGKVIAAEIKPGKVKTVNGKDVIIAVENGKVKVNEATVIKPDVKTSNGVIHVIDNVIIP